MPVNYCPKCGPRKRSEIIPYAKGVRCSVCDWKSIKPKVTPAPRPKNTEGIYISKRKLESYKRAEKVCRELRFQFAHAQRNDQNKLINLIIHWMEVTGKIKMDRPE